MRKYTVTSDTSTAKIIQKKKITAQNFKLHPNKSLLINPSSMEIFQVIFNIKKRNINVHYFSKTLDTTGHLLLVLVYYKLNLYLKLTYL